MIKGKILNPLNGTGFPVGNTLCRWCEDPAAIGLRLVGFADEVPGRSVDHQGWFLDDDFQEEVARGIVYRLPTRKGRAQFIAGMADPDNDGPAMLSLGTIEDDEREAARSADHLAECYAEAERDYRRASSARLKWGELGEEVAAARRSILDLCREIKALCRAGGSYTIRNAPAVRAELERRIRGLLDDIREAREKRGELASNFARDKGWTDNDQGESYAPAAAAC